MEAAHWSSLKINVDASILTHRNAAGIGVVIRDGLSNVVAWRQWIVEYIVSPETAETYAVQYGVDLALELGLRDVILETGK